MNPSKTDEESAQADVAMLLSYGIGAPGPRRSALFGDGAVGAAVTLDRLGVQPRWVAFLSRTVRSAGTGYTARLPELLPEPAASDLMRGWLEAIAELIGLRRTTRERAAR
ncbi:hypothetical protein ACFVJ4_36985 [Streptomyces sp. NPDC127178]|uniref:hypothetical protein n=1 Tax=unclassified Streptomyces TaxID=2593676 RepID=UPI0036355BE9